MQLGRRRKLKIAVAVAVLLQIALVTVMSAIAYDGRLIPAGESSFVKPVLLCFARPQVCKNSGTWFGLGKIPGVSGVALSAASLRFDLKQNLSTWPVLSNGNGRSPPLLSA